MQTTQTSTLNFTPKADSSGYIVEDGYSPRANPRRGYHDYLRILTTWGLSQDAVKNLSEKMLADLKPGSMWASMKVVSAQPSHPNVTVVHFSFGYDSGD